MTTLHKAAELENNLKNATNILQSVINGTTTYQLAQVAVNALNQFLDNHSEDSSKPKIDVHNAFVDFNTEAEWIASVEHLNCPACGGSGHIDDIHKPALAQEPAQSAVQEPLFWYRPRSDGFYEGPIHNAQIEQVRKESGAWVPLYAAPQPAVQEPAQQKPWWRKHADEIELKVASGRMDAMACFTQMQQLLQASDAPQQAVQESANFIVSAVLVKETATGFNTQNKLYRLGAANPDEAKGKSLPLIQRDFPRHELHTICLIAIDAAKEQQA